MKLSRPKSLLYEQVARVGRALSSPKRLELLELLAQGEKPVESLAMQAAIDMRLASAHLRVLREARLVESRRDGRHIHYRLSGPDVAKLWVSLRETAEEHIVELRIALDGMAADPTSLIAESRESLLDRARAGEVTVIDVRPADEYAAGHLPYARSIPLAELATRLAELPPGGAVAAYCRGPFCLMAEEAVQLLRSRGYTAYRLTDGVSEWIARGLPVAT